jgi:long-chain fatty acid transport protein
MPSPSGRSRLAVALALAAAPGWALSDDSNFRPYLVGARAAGLGGAYTALSDDGAGAWYNPGGLAFVRRSQLSLSGSVYGVVSGSFQDALGDGHDFKFRNLNTLPTATAGVWKLGAPEASEADVLAFGVFVPDAMTIDDRDTILSQQNAFFYSAQTQSVWAGATYARRMGRVGIGASAFFLLGTSLFQTDITAVAAATPTRFATIAGRIDETQYGVMGAAGLRWDATDELRVGLSVYSPVLGTGSRRFFAKGLAADGSAAGTAQAVVVNVDDLHSTPSQPLRAQAGLAWVSGPLTLAADVVFLAPREVRDDEDRAALGLDKRVTRNAVVNGSIGVEILLTDRVPLRLGFFTDLAASNAPTAYSTAGNDPNADNTSHIDRFGGSISIGFKTEHTATDIGLSVSAGSGSDLVPNNLDFSQYKPTTATHLLVYLFLGTSYEF